MFSHKFCRDVIMNIMFVILLMYLCFTAVVC